MAEDWEKTVLTDEEIIAAHEGELCRDRGRFIAKAQAKTAYQAGEKAGIQKGKQEVVEWIKSHSQLEQCDPDTMAYFTDYYAIVKADWQSKLKEWGLERMNQNPDR